MHTDGAFYLSSAFILCVFWYIFRDLVDAYSNAAKGAVPQEIVGAVLRSIVHVQLAKLTNKKTKTEMAELFEERLATTIYCAASFSVLP